MTAFAVIVGIIGAATGLYALWQNGKLATQSDRIQERLAAVEEARRRDELRPVIEQDIKVDPRDAPAFWQVNGHGRETAPGQGPVVLNCHTL